MTKDNDLSKKMIEDVIETVNIPTVFSEVSTQGKPFGYGVNRGLLKVLEIGNSMGFATKNYEGYVGEIDAGTGNYIIGILCHVDVVAAGDGWDDKPFVAKEKDGKIWGRGVSDNKGPMIAALYAMKRLADKNQIPDDVTIRMIIGTNEEESWEDMKYYIDKQKILPNVSLVPDAFFPIIYCEKGLYDFDLSFAVKINEDAKVKLKALKAGNGRNMVIDKASVVLEGEEEILDHICDKMATVENLVIKKVSSNEVIMELLGVGAHAMAPEKGVCAMSKLVRELSNMGKGMFSHEEFIDIYDEYLSDDYYGVKCGFDCSDSDSGALTFNVGKINMDNSLIRLECNVRYPASLSFEYIERTIIDKVKNIGFDFNHIDHLAPIYFPKDSDLVNLLMSVYQRVTGDKESKPISMGGATYARAIPNSVAFGCIFPYEEEVAHEPNEFMSIESLKKSHEVIYEALKELCKTKV